ncbi:MAG: NAD(P)-binding domain-containing protein [Bacteroidales bacterium]|nr:NAD(P)-binding domain-containing protein [Bacteroidales bacterium]
MLNKNIAVIGSGSWGTALVKLLGHNLDKIGWWVRHEDTKHHVMVHGRNPDYLQYAELLPEKIDISTDMKEIVENYDILIFAIPSAFLKKSIIANNVTDLSNKIIISAIKGIVPESNQIVANYFHTDFNIKYEDIGIIAGPCHAEEVAMQKLSFLTIAFLQEERAQHIADLFSTWFMKMKTSTDIAGTEYSAMIKNIIAIANGICVGLGYGDNFQAVLIVNAMREIRRFLEDVFPQYRKVMDTEYVGDLLVTSYSKFSRNRTFGTYIGRGYSIKATMAEMKMVSEGYYAVKCLMEINKEHQVYLPITEAVYNILYEGVSPIVEMKLLSDKLN